MPIEHEAVDCPKCDGFGQIYVVDSESLRLTREAAGLSKEQMARRAKVSLSLVHKIESGARACSAKLEKVYANL